ncbi:hypothetical protein [Acinetobacter johnsonii]|uniref:Uncharacterized protein n=1 Tax=Acinetobacter johnsonii TaxID=40214 RepID=A0A380TUP7_ACIJO|nr:hypothetical protein [Acinetobacter johnsonii]ENU40186.1 hypothetical protein F986_01099 [Acinetobacter johnsonii CIP 64.6]QPS02829.1 hypothetical protein I6G67_11325 [Acinetobacter johnsonii]SUT91372.1 Uncharacterised protein [Acinetobacter johnsonii]
MKIKYLRKAPQGMPGDVAEVPDLQAKILIKLKFAESLDGELSIEFLKNLNGTLVVDDFGSLVELPLMVEHQLENVQQVVQEEKPVKPKQKRASKAK